METRATEQDSLYQHLEKMSSKELLENINREDQKVALAVENKLIEIENLVNAAFEKMNNGGRLFYVGAGTSGRLGILDASECPPTYGVPHGLVVGIIAGGDFAIRKAVEFAEDDINQCWSDLKAHNITSQDFVIGITASGTTPYVLGGIRICNENGIETGGISCNKNAALSSVAKYAIEIETGPEFVTGSTRMKAGTAQKLVLNMISSSLMIKLGRVKGNKMVDMQLSNQKLIERGANIIMAAKGLDFEAAKALLLEKGNVRAALEG